METKNLRNKFDLKELELNSLLEITQAINNNLPEESLYKIYHFTLRATLNIKKLALFVLDELWNCKVNFGTKTDFVGVPLDCNFFDIKDIKKLDFKNKESLFSEFDTIIPVTHKENILAFVFLGSTKNASDIYEGEPNTTFLQALSNIILVAIENKKLARRQLMQEAMKKELEIAWHVQQYLFPKNLPYTDILKIDAVYLPHHQVGGDYYDFLPISDNRFLLCIADVSGKGVPAAILMSNFQASLRTLVRKTTNLKEIVEDLNYQILQNANGENFITFFVAIYDRANLRMDYVNAGHNPPVLMTKNDGYQLLSLGTTILGSFHPLPFLNEGKIENLKEFLFFSYTDGLPETFNDVDEPFGIERLQEFLVKHSNEDLKIINKNILKELDEFKGSITFGDDITILSCRVEEMQHLT
ncbi:MAG: PP2C family protein-serine/threonine phosphatase [Bacteroidota bacterium]|nr:PP2C family protein-serine/threonine phosphatase [Bacteroidota bacterium]